MKIRRMVTWALASAMCVSMLSGCGGGSAQSGETPAAKEQSGAGAAGTDQGAAAGEKASGETAGGKVLRYQVSTLVDSMDPALSNDYTSCGVLSQCMMGLHTKDESGTPVYGVAESETKSEDGLTITFKIRDDAFWANGDPVTAHDFVYAWRRVADPATASSYQFFIQTACIVNADDVVAGNLPVEELGVKAEDDKTLVVSLSSPCPIFDFLMTSTCFLPLSESFVESCGAEFATSPETINCNGPFKVSSYEPSTMEVDLVKNDKFFGADEVKLDGVQFRIITDSQTAALSFENGDLDVVTLSGNLIEQYQDDPRYSTRSDGYNWYICPNLNREGLDNLNIRMAMAKSFDKEAVTKHVLKDGSSPMDFFVPVGLAASDEGVDFRESAGDGYDSWKYNVEEAQELWKKGLEELGVSSLSFTFMCEDTDSAQAVAQFLQSEWQTNLPGLTIELQVLPKKARLEYMKKGEYDVGLTRWGPDYADPITDLDMWVTGSSTNYSQYSDPEYDETIRSAKAGELALDPAARWDALVGCEKKLADECVLYPVYGQSVAVMTNPEISGIQYYSVGLPYLFIHADKN